MKHLVKRLSWIPLIVFLCLNCSCAQNSSVQKAGLNQKPRYYTSYNIWKWPALNMKCINYKGNLNSILPVGTEVSKPKIAKVKSSSITKEVIRFKTLNDNKIFQIYFVKKYHPHKTIHDYMDYMVTTKNLEELTADLNETEINAIKKGVIIDGMSKKAVLICYGPPPEHATHSLDSKKWTYWKNKRHKKQVLFNSQNSTGPEYIQKTDTTTIEEKILKLNNLFDKNLITQEEYDTKKAALLESL